MKEQELRQHSTCSLCRKPIGASGIPLFWRVKVERFGVDLGAIRRQDGLAAMLGGHSGLAAVMGANEDMAKPVMEPRTITVCEPCSQRNTTVLEMGMPE